MFKSCAIRLLFAAAAALAPLTLESASAQAQQAAALKPAAEEDIFLYRGMGSSYVCNARTAEVEFPKAVGIAAATYVQVLNGRHGGKVQSVGDQKLSNEQLLSGAEFQIITGALRFCPDEVPADVKAKVEEAIAKEKVKADQ
ncbi:MAG: cAMP phosphodiesterase [Synechococcus sp.]